MKKLILSLCAFFTLSTLSSCSSWMSEEAKASGKAGAASGRINSSENNSKDVFKELDE